MVLCYQPVLTARLLEHELNPAVSRFKLSVIPPGGPLFRSPMRLTALAYSPIVIRFFMLQATALE
jgi:hypothetical protein